MRQAVQEGVHESPTDSRPPSSASHSDADQLEVPSQPCLVEGERCRNGELVCHPSAHEVCSRAQTRSGPRKHTEA